MQKYLERHAEAEARALELDVLRELGPWTHGLTIPARRESIECLGAAAAPARRASVLTILVVNAGEGPDDRRSNVAVLEAIEAAARWRAPGFTLATIAGLDVLAVDRTRPPRQFGARDGVGLARKIGADLLIKLIAAGVIESPWIHTTDADARLPAEHFDRVAGLAGGAAIAPFRHVEAEDADEPEVHAATLAYEQSLHYYVAGLRHAGSPYAFHTIGSLISVAAPAYVQVRGFPRREAGEDFYMLNKLAKLGPIHQLTGAPVEIRSRRSTRAPFGTGPAVEALLGGRGLEVYDPRVFEVLRAALEALAELAETGDPGRLEALAAVHDELRPWLADALALRRRYPRVQLGRRIHEHLDGFRTLMLIHALTHRWPKLPWATARARAPFFLD